MGEASDPQRSTLHRRDARLPRRFQPCHVARQRHRLRDDGRQRFPTPSSIDELLDDPSALASPHELEDAGGLKRRKHWGRESTWRLGDAPPAVVGAALIADRARTRDAGRYGRLRDAHARQRVEWYQ